MIYQTWLLRVHDGRDPEWVLYTEGSLEECLEDLFDFRSGVINKHSTSAMRLEARPSA